MTEGVKKSFTYYRKSSLTTTANPGSRYRNRTGSRHQGWLLEPLDQSRTSKSEKQKTKQNKTVLGASSGCHLPKFTAPLPTSHASSVVHVLHLRVQLCASYAGTGGHVHDVATPKHPKVIDKPLGNQTLVPGTVIRSRTMWSAS